MYIFSSPNIEGLSLSRDTTVAEGTDRSESQLSAAGCMWLKHGSINTAKVSGNRVQIGVSAAIWLSGRIRVFIGSKYSDIYPVSGRVSVVEF